MPLARWLAVLFVVPLATATCGRVGYQRVGAVGSDAGVDVALDASGDGPGELPPPDLPAPPDAAAPDAPPDVVPPDMAPPDMAPPDMPLPDRSDPDGPTAGPPTLLGASSTSANRAVISLDHEVGAGSNRYLVVAVATETETRMVLTVSFGGRLMSALGAERVACGAFLFGLADPPAGRQPVVVTLDGTSDTAVTAAGFTGVAPTASLTITATRSGTTSPITVTVPSQPGQLVLDSVCLDHPAPVLSPASGQTLLGVRGSSTFAGGASARNAGDLVTMSWTFTGVPAGGWTSVIAVLRPAR